MNVRASGRDARDRLAIALDGLSAEGALHLVDAIGDFGRVYKLGPGLLLESGPDTVRALHDRGKAVFLDLKFHDIPQTVASAVAASVRLGVALLTVHAGGGAEMLRAARHAAPPGCGTRLVAVSVLTSLDAGALRETLGDAAAEPAALALRLARLARAAGFDGVVASAREARALRDALGPDALIVTPGIRAATGEAADQRRVLSARDAIAEGADLLVVGRPIVLADSPPDAVRALIAEIEAALP